MTKIPWNKGLTKADPRVAKYTEKMRITKTGIPVKHAKQFKKGMVPWNKGKKYTEQDKAKLNTDGLQYGRGRTKGQLLKISYMNIHYWVRKQKGKASKCTDCGATEGKFEWANIDHKYSLNLNDYIELCKPCHGKLDIEIKKKAGEHK